MAQSELYCRQASTFPFSCTGYVYRNVHLWKDRERRLRAQVLATIATRTELYVGVFWVDVAPPCCFRVYLSTTYHCGSELVGSTLLRNTRFKARSPAVKCQRTHPAYLELVMIHSVSDKKMNIRPVCICHHCNQASMLMYFLRTFR